MATETVETYTNGQLVATRTETIPPELANQRSLQDRARQALDANNTFLALASPTNLQTLAQVRAMTRQLNALIRLELDDLQDVSDA